MADKGKQRGASGRHGSRRSREVARGAAAIPASLKDWQALWEAFQRSHHDWWSAIDARQPVYHLPEKVVEVLSRSMPSSGEEHRGHRPLISPQEAGAENNFRAVCQKYSTAVVGVWNGMPVLYAPFAQGSAPSLTAQSMRALRWGDILDLPSASAGIAAAMEKADGARHQQLAYAGWLTFQPPYRTAVESLRRLWSELDVKPGWPLLACVGDRSATPAAGQPDGSLRLPDETATLLEHANKLMRKWGVAGRPLRTCVGDRPAPPTAGQPDGSLRLSDKTATFLEQATKLMRKFSLASLVTWDLPLAQGPLEQVPVDLARQVLGPDQAASFFPSYYDVSSKQDMRQELRMAQEAAGKEAGVNTDFPLTDLSARAGKASEWESAFRCWFIERAASARYAGRRGLTTRLLEAIANTLACSDNWVQHLRRRYKSFLSSPPST